MSSYLMCNVLYSNNVYTILLKAINVLRRKKPHGMSINIIHHKTRAYFHLPNLLPHQVTFLNAFKVPSLSILPSKTKEIVFQALNRSIWTPNKDFKSGIAKDAVSLHVRKWKQRNIFFMVVRIILPKYGI
jgi:hypothetical protein